jgi:threonine dehydrogenase-like Zn-dependent dehydrogenase
MEALRWHGERDIRVDEVPKPEIEEPTDAIVEITATAICGSDLHLYNDFMPGLEEGYTLGHEPMGEVAEVGDDVENLDVGDRVVVPFTIGCGDCWFCENDLYSLCDETNPNAEMAAEAMGHSPAGLLGFAQMLGGYAGGQAEYLRVPHADVGPVEIESGLSDEEVLFLSDIFPTGYMAAENAEIGNNDTVAVWGCGPVGQFAIQSAWMMGADRVVAIDRVDERLEMAEDHADTEVIDYSTDDVYDWLMDETGGRGPDRCIDAVGSEAHHTCVDSVPNEPDRPYVLQEAIKSCRKGGTLSIPGVYLGGMDDVPMGPLMNKALTVNTGQTHVQAYTNPLLEKIEDGEIDPTEIITHRGSLADGPEFYETFNNKEDDCVKVVLEP